MAEEIYPGIEILDLALHLTSEDCLILSDLQLGYESHLTRKGTLIPRFNYAEIIKRFEEKILPIKSHFKTIIINGDLKHEFGAASEQEWKEVTDFLQFLKPHCAEVQIVKGNHDIALEPLGAWSRVKIQNELLFEKEKILICHGHQIPSQKMLDQAKVIVIGHDHPAVSIHDGNKKETFKAFLKGTWKNKILIVLPSFNFLTLGSNVSREKMLSPFLQQSLEEFECWLVEDQPYYFGKIKELME